jgi:hypothetical protein
MVLDVAQAASPFVYFTDGDGVFAVGLVQRVWWTDHVINRAKKGTQGTLLLRVLGNANKITNVNINVL